MSEPFVFDSRCEVCKKPFGAVVCGTKVEFHVRPMGYECFTHCALVVHREFADIHEEHEMTFACWEGDRVRFDLTYTAPKEAELVWYWFRVWRDDQSGCLLDQTGYQSNREPSPWQLTVYRKSRTPSWFGSGVTYQIFPDRFCRLSIPDPTGLIGDRIVHENWDDTPEWRPDEYGEIRNRDFFGGSLKGIISKLDWLEALGVTTIYLCPIFESASNHRYNTADYRAIDPFLGNESDFRTLCSDAAEHGMRVILDGVFNHTGSQSIYFNQDGWYPTEGAAQTMQSQWYDWYRFYHWPDQYESWWGIRTLPAVEESCPSYIDYIIEGWDSVVRHWLRVGASGWRLDVADELPDWFIEKIRTAMEETKPDSILLGEVWEDGSNKISYSQRRRYLLGSEVHGLMNYPFREAVLAYLRGGKAEKFRDSMETIREHYPPAAFYSAMNFLGTHDTARILTILGTDHIPDSKDARAEYRLSYVEWERGIRRLKLAALLLFTFPGSPTIYYGDEVGMEGCEDPFNRRTYPWGQENAVLLDWYGRLGALRRNRESLQWGDIKYLWAKDSLLVYRRHLEEESTVVAINASGTAQHLDLPLEETESLQDALSGCNCHISDGKLSLDFAPYQGLLLF